MNSEIIKKFFGQMKNTKALVVILIVGIGLLAMPVKKETKSQEETPSDALLAEYCAETEEKLARLLSSVKGVGKAEVMITFSDEGQTFFAQDEQSDKDSKEETSKTSMQTSHVLKNDDGGGESPLITRKNTPNVSGVLVICSGAKDPAVKSQIVSAVQALLGVRAHRVEVLEKK